MGFAASVGMQLLLWFPRRWFPYLFTIGIISFLGACPFMGGVLDASAHNRVVWWGMANRQFMHNPIFGLGYEMFWQVTQKGEALHNAYVACYTDLGFFGYWFWFGLLYLGFAGAVRAFYALKGVSDNDAKWLRSLARQILVASFGFCASAYFLSRTFLYPLFFLMAMLAVVPQIARRYLPPDHPPFFPKRKKLFWDITVAAVISIIYIYISCILLNKAFYG